MMKAIQASEERTRKDMSDRHYKFREEIIKGSYRGVRQIINSAEDLKLAVAEDNNRVISETYDTVAEARDNTVRRVSGATKTAIREGVAGSYFSPEVRRVVGTAELHRIAGSRVAAEWNRTTPTESVFTETDKILRGLDKTVKNANSTLVAAEALLGLMRQRMEKIKDEVKEFKEKTANEIEDNETK